jgi:hypothetical protein
VDFYRRTFTPPRCQVGTTSTFRKTTVQNKVLAISKCPKIAVFRRESAK